MGIFSYFFFGVIALNLIVGYHDPELLIIIPLLLVMWWGISSERNEWNDGICKISGKPWIRFDTDSQGGRGYTDKEGHYCWISYNVDEKYEHNRV